MRISDWSSDVCSSDLLLNMPVKQQIGILRGTFSQLRPGGAMHLFTYGPRCPVPQRVLDRLGLRARHTETVLANMPRSEERRVGKECVSKGRTRWSPDH